MRRAARRPPGEGRNCPRARRGCLAPAGPRIVFGERPIWPPGTPRAVRRQHPSGGCPDRWTCYRQTETYSGPYCRRGRLKRAVRVHPQTTVGITMGPGPGPVAQVTRWLKLAAVPLLASWRSPSPGDGRGKIVCGAADLAAAAARPASTPRGVEAWPTRPSRPAVPRAAPTRGGSGAAHPVGPASGALPSRSPPSGGLRVSGAPGVHC